MSVWVDIDQYIAPQISVVIPMVGQLCHELHQVKHSLSLWSNASTPDNQTTNVWKDAQYFAQPQPSTWQCLQMLSNMLESTYITLWFNLLNLYGYLNVTVHIEYFVCPPLMIQILVKVISLASETRMVRLSLMLPFFYWDHAHKATQHTSRQYISLSELL
jgi:hypothetical protein